AVVQGLATPDHFVVFKAKLDKFRPIIERTLGSKKVKMVARTTGESKRIRTSKKEQTSFSISNKEVLQLARWAVQIEKSYQTPMDIEWAKDARNNKLYIVQARPETVEARRDINVLKQYQLERTGRVLAKGTAIGSKIGSGKAHLITSPKELSKFKAGEVLITKMTDPAWEPIMKIAAAIVTDQGGRTSHAAIVSRELGVPAIVGAGNATKMIKNGAQVTVSCSEGEEGHIYAGLLPFKIRRTNVSNLKKPPVQVMMNLGDPGQAFTLSHIPCDGVGLAREEFIVANLIGVHPMALVEYKKIRKQKNKKIIQDIDKLLVGYKKPTDLFVERLASGIAKIAAAFYPNDVIVRFSDFKTNEYASLIGGELFEPKEENPMLGWRGASRYYDPAFEPAFLLECEAFRRVRDEMGLTNVVPMIPFCRTPEEGKKVLQTMSKAGLHKGKNKLRVYVMIEIPSNVILADEFAQIFDGFSIGSNDLTQLTLGVDRDTTKLHTVGDERNKAVVTLVKEVIKKARKHKVKIGICGQAPSDYPEFAQMLVDAGIDSISVIPDTVLSTRIALSGKKRKR
ncbi:MAG: phosphoenolpyruvate synthase, partial [Candidatus Uhrbacteria bacterium]